MTIMQKAAKKTARHLLRDFNEVEQLQVSIKGPGDFVSHADLRAEAILYEELRKMRPDYSFLMEESGHQGDEDWTWRWIIDPLDGTTNFLHGLPNWAISIALQKRESDGTYSLQAALISSPSTNEIFYAEEGKGAFLNEQRIRVSARRTLKESLLATGIPFAKTKSKDRLAFAHVLGHLMPKVAGVRRMGSAALDLACVACGRYEGYWEFGVSPWDCAAGILIVKEAGGVVTGSRGESLENLPKSIPIISGNPYIYKKLMEIVNKIK